MQPVADNIDMRQFVFVREDFPFRIKQRRGAQPGFQILVENLLGFQIFGDDHNGTRGKKPVEQRGKKRLRG